MKTLASIVLVALAVPAAAAPMKKTLHGFTVRDAHEHLETDEGAKTWVDRANAATKAFLDKAPVQQGPIQKRLDELSKIGYVGRASLAKDRTFYARRVGDAEQPVLLVREPDGKERVLLDVSSLDQGGKVALDWYHPSPSGKRIAYGLSKDGSEQSVLHVLDVDAGKDLGEKIPDTRAASVAWLKDESGFFYTRYPPGENYDRRVYFHRLGDDPGKDRLVFGEGLEKTDWTSVSIAHDDRNVFFSVSKGWSKTEIHLHDRKTGKTRKIVGAELNALFGAAEMIDGKMVVVTNHEAPRFKIVAIDPASPKPSRWRTIVPQGEWPIEGATYSAGKIVVSRTVKAVSHVELFRFDGKPVGEVELPGLGSVEGLSADFDGKRLVFGFVTFLAPPAVYELPLGDAVAKPRLVAAVPKQPDTSAFTVQQVEYPSYDGTRIPMFLIHKKGVKQDAKNLVMLTGYGGFNISLTPAFSTNALFWAERGGVYAVANLRGGAEFGEEWHDAGKLGNKHQVFRDFEYAMRWLIREDWTRPDRLAITGGSNGGLLMGAMVTQAPELFRVAVGRVGLYDMLKFHTWLIGGLWVDEYGSSENPEQIGYLLGYSPYHQVLDGVSYPAFLGTTAHTDTRVSWIHTAKFVARLQEAQGGKAPVHFYMEKRAGHGQGKGRSDRVAEEVMMWQFVLSQLPQAGGSAKTASAP